MTIEQIITLLENKIVFIRSQLTAATQRGDMVAVDQCSNDLSTTQSTLDQLRTLM